MIKIYGKYGYRKALCPSLFIALLRSNGKASLGSGSSAEGGHIDTLVNYVDRGVILLSCEMAAIASELA